MAYANSEDPDQTNYHTFDSDFNGRRHTNIQWSEWTIMIVFVPKDLAVKTFHAE